MEKNEEASLDLIENSEQPLSSLEEKIEPVLCINGEEKKKRKKKGTCWATVMEVTEPYRGVLYAIVSCVFLSLSSIQVKLATSVHPLEVALARMTIQLFIVVIEMLVRKVPFFSYSGKHLFLFLRALSGVSSMAFLFTSFLYLQLADAVTLRYSSPVFVAIASCLILREPCGIFEVLMTVLTVVGVVLIGRPTFLFPADLADPDPRQHAVGVALALSSAITNSAGYIVLRKLRDVHAAAVVFYYSFYGVVLLLITSLSMNILKLPGSVPDLFWLIGSGICGYAGQTCLVIAMRLENATAVSVAKTLEVLFAFVLEVVILHENPSWISLLGAAVVVSSVTLIGVKKSLPGRCDKYDFKMKEHDPSRKNCLQNCDSRCC